MSMVYFIDVISAWNTGLFHQPADEGVPQLQPPIFAQEHRPREPLAPLQHDVAGVHRAAAGGNIRPTLPPPDPYPNRVHPATLVWTPTSSFGPPLRASTPLPAPHPATQPQPQRTTLQSKVPTSLAYLRPWQFKETANCYQRFVEIKLSLSFSCVEFMDCTPHYTYVVAAIIAVPTSPPL